MRHAALLLALLAACTDDGPSGGGPTGTAHVESYFLPAMSPPKLDLLFVVDDTTAMASHQAALQALPMQLEQLLEGAYGIAAHYHIGVVTTDYTKGGDLLRSAAFDGAFIIHDATFTGPANNYQGSLANAVASVWPSSAASTMENWPLGTIDAALDGNVANAGFLRDDAYLGVVTITASDDVSLNELPETYAGMLKTTKQDPNRVIVTGAIPANAPRLEAFYAQFPNRSDLTSIDDADYAGVVEIFTRLYMTSLGYACNKEPADLDLETPGAQVDCSFVWIENGAEHLLPQCGAATGPCWEIVVASPEICVDPAARAHLQTRGFTMSPSTFGDPFHPEVRGQCLVN